jgi:hypothetical protein
MNIAKPLCCVVCKKDYTRKSSYERHKLLCDFKLKTPREHQIEIEELGDIPSHFQLVKIVQELSSQVSKLTTELNEMKKYVEKKKRKLNAVLWLNTKINPTMGFLEWVHTSLTVNSSHFEYLMDGDNSIYVVIQRIFEDNISPSMDFVYPISAFTEKPGVFYICEKQASGEASWALLEMPDMLLMLKKIQNGLVRELTNWKTINKGRMDDNDRLAIAFQRAIQKLFSISFTQDNNFSKMKNSLYAYLKTDLKSVEFEFEF